MGFSSTFQILSRYGIVLRELQGSTDPVRLRAEEMLIPNSALGNRAGLLSQDHGLVSVVAGNGHMILRWTEIGCVDFRSRLRAAGSGECVAGEVYEVDAAALAAMDELEGVGRPDGYHRKALQVQGDGAEVVMAQVYMKHAHQIVLADVRVGPLAAYTMEHAALYRKRGEQAY